MDNPAPSDHPIHDLIARRWSSRAIDPDRPVTADVLRSLLEAARWAPSSGNEQPWRFVIFDGRDPAAREAARDCLNPGNAWARRAPLLLLAAAETRRARDGSPNRYAQHDVGLATENLLLQAFALGLIAHPMAGFDKDKARLASGVPEGVEPTTMIAVGHGGDDLALTEAQRARERGPRVRRPLSQLAFHGRWQRPLDGDAGA
jgi:nitroreductase